MNTTEEGEEAELSASTDLTAITVLTYIFLALVTFQVSVDRTQE